VSGISTRCYEETASVEFEHKGHVERNCKKTRREGWVSGRQRYKAVEHSTSDKKGDDDIAAVVLVTRRLT